MEGITNQKNVCVEAMRKAQAWGSKGLQRVRATIYMDMDGVLAIWDPRVKPEDTYKPNFFLRCMPEKVVLDAIHLLRKKYRVVFLSHAYGEMAQKEKRTWLDQLGLADVPAIFVPYGEPKADFIKKIGTGKSLLVDDYSKNLHHWEKSGFTGVKFYNRINGTNGTWTGPFVHYQMTAKEIADTVERIIRISK